jgi:hypothetical protein
MDVRLESVKYKVIDFVKLSSALYCTANQIISRENIRIERAQNSLLDIGGGKGGEEDMNVQF